MYRKKIIVLLGSTKADSVNRKIVDYFIQKTQSFFEVALFPLETLPYFNPDLDGDLTPTPVLEFREKIAQADGVLISTPEYVFSIPGVLKNALEWTVSTIVFNQKPTAIITAASSGKIAHESIQLIMKTIGALLEDSCVVLIGSPKSKIDTNGVITNKEQEQVLISLIQDFQAQLNSKS